MILKAGGDFFLCGAAADIQEVGGLAAIKLDDVHGRHGQARAIDHAADLAVELDVGEIVFAGFDFGGIFFVQVAQRLDVLVAVKRIVVEIDLGIQADDLAVLGDDQRIDFQQAHILGDEGVVEALDHLADLLGVIAFQPRAAAISLPT